MLALSVCHNHAAAVKTGLGAKGLAASRVIKTLLQLSLLLHNNGKQSIRAYISRDKELTCSITAQTALFFCNK